MPNVFAVQRNTNCSPEAIPSWHIEATWNSEQQLLDHFQQDVFYYDDYDYRLAEFSSYPSRTTVPIRVLLTRPKFQQTWFDMSEIPGEKKQMIKLQCKREEGVLSLYINAAELHSILDSIGVKKSGLLYNNMPPNGDTTPAAIGTSVLLEATYPKKIQVNRYFNAPPSFAQLTNWCKTANQAVKRILEWYQPIDISIDIQKKILK